MSTAGLQALSDTALDALAEFLGNNTNPDAPTLEGLDGFYCALGFEGWQFRFEIREWITAAGSLQSSNFPAAHLADSMQTPCGLRPAEQLSAHWVRRT
jgi:hypothetical protein